MLKIELQHNKGLKWIKINNIYFKGHFFDKKNKLYQDPKSIQKYFSVCNSEIIFKKKIKVINGNFAVIMQNTNKLLVAVDKFRSIPLFYSVKNDNFYVSDNAYWLKQKLSLNKIDPVSEKEFLATRYVSGENTLFKEVKQIQAGECLTVVERNNKIEFKKEIYYRYLHKNFTKKNQKDLFKELNIISENVFKRLIKSIDKNATIVIPLSGGYDSRYIAVMLKKINYKNVICFSYGKKNNKEATISKKVANKLGYKWFFVEYTPEKWFNWLSLEERIKYQKFAENLCSVMHIQDFLAVKKLKNEKLIPENSVFVPGHSGDLLGGSHTPKDIKIKKIYNIKHISKYLFKTHYLNNYHSNKNDFLSKIKCSLSKIYKNNRLLSAEEFVSLTDFWNVSNRQAKFIINSVRVYEFWGHQWRIPLWDIELVSFWLKVPLKYRLKNKLYNGYLMSLFEQNHIDFKKNKKSYFLLKSKKLLQPMIPNRIFALYRRKIDALEILSALKLFFKKNNFSTKKIIGSNLNLYLANIQIINLKKIK